MALAAISSRRLIAVSGQDASSYLQGLFTVDLRKLTESNKLIAGAFLNAKGRVLYDVLVAKRTDKDGSAIFDIETGTEGSEDLVAMLRRFKLRKKVVITPDDSRKVYAVWSNGIPANIPPDQASWFVDPRPSARLGHRVWSSSQPSLPGNGSPRILDESVYHQIRLACGFPEGLAESEDELPFVLNYDWWPNTLVYDKGCYTGQELIARTHFKGQVRKRAIPVVLSTPNQAKHVDELLPAFASWKVPVTTSAVPPKKSAIVPIPGVDTGVGEGSLLALAPGGLNIGLAAFKEAQAVPAPGTEFKPTHQIVLENGEKVDVCPIRPDWWPSVESK